MAQGGKKVGPMGLSVLLHASLVAMMFFSFSFAERPRPPITPMAIQASLVPDASAVKPPPVRQAEPEPVVETVVEPIDEPVVEETPEPEVDDSAEKARLANEEKRRQDALIEQERLDKIRQQEIADQQQKEREAEERVKREEAERKKRDEEEQEKRRLEAERKREEDIKRQREENERRRKELEDEMRADEINEEAERLAADSSPEMAVYVNAIRQKIYRNWSVPASARDDMLCTAIVRQVPSGEVISVRFAGCNGDEAVRRSIESAIYKSSPLPAPSTSRLFRRDLELNLTKQ